MRDPARVAVNVIVVVAVASVAPLTPMGDVASAPVRTGTNRVPSLVADHVVLTTVATELLTRAQLMSVMPLDTTRCWIFVHAVVEPDVVVVASVRVDVAVSNVDRDSSTALAGGVNDAVLAVVPDAVLTYTGVDASWFSATRSPLPAQAVGQDWV